MNRMAQLVSVWPSVQEVPRSIPSDFTTFLRNKDGIVGKFEAFSARGPDSD